MKRVNHFGLFPINPDNNLNSEAYGVGTTRPVGFTFSEMFKMYWTVRSFKCDIFSNVIGDPLINAFLGGGAGTAGTILGSIAGLNNANINSDGAESFTGYTKIQHYFTQKLRKGKRDIASQELIDLYTFEGIQKGVTQKQISASKGIELKTMQSSVYEGSLFSNGPQHYLSNSGGLGNYVLIDFSDIKYYQRLYWPTIKINSANFSSFKPGRLAVGGITFNGTAIQMNYNGTSLLGVAVINGLISIGQRCCDRFLYDNFDKERKEKKECAGCEQIP